MTLQIHSFLKNTGGINMQSNLSAPDPDEAEEIENLHLVAGGVWSSRNVGYTQVTQSPLNSGSRVNGIYCYKELNGVTHNVVAVGSKIFEISLATGQVQEIASGLTPNVPVNFCTFQGVLIAANGREAPKKWTGQGMMMDLSGWPPAIAGVVVGNPGFSQVFANRLVFSGDPNNPSVIYLSELENPQIYTPTTGAKSAGAIQVSPGDGQRITGLRTIYLPLNNQEVLLIFKERSIFMLTGHDADTFTLQKISSELGAVSHDAIVLLGSEVIFLAEHAIFSLTTATVQGNIASSSLSQKLMPLISRLNRSALGASFAVHFANREEIWWFLPEGAAAQNQTVLIQNYSLGRSVWSRRTGITASCGQVIDNNLYTGTYSGHLHRQMEGNSYNGLPVVWRYRTPFYFLGDPRLRKRIRDLEVLLTQFAPLSFTLSTVWDHARAYYRKASRTISIPLDAVAVPYGVAVYGSGKYLVPDVHAKRVGINGSGRALQLEFSGSQTQLPIELQGWKITAIEGGLA